jgi:hypothetical protein
MSDLATTAQRLRVVKEASTDFLLRWAVDDLMSEMACGERLWGDLLAGGEADPGNIVFSKFARKLDD